MNFPSNFLFLTSLFSTISNFSFHLTSVFILLSNSATISFTFSKSFSLFQLLCFVIDLFYYTKYFIISLIFLFNIFFTFYSSTPSSSTGFTSFIFCPSTYFLYHTIQLTSTTGWILIEVGSYNLTILVDTTLLNV